jgi:hypothetical protein
MEMYSEFRGLFQHLAPAFSPTCFTLWSTLMTGWLRVRSIESLVSGSILAGCFYPMAWCLKVCAVL